MKVVSTDGQLRSITQENISQVIVYDLFDNPIMVVVEVQPGVHTCVAANDKDFNRIMAGLGIDKVVIDTPLIPDREIPAEAKLISGPFGSVQ